MKELIDKIDDFLFDFLGLIVPGFMIIVLIVTPLMILDIKSSEISNIDKSSVMAVLHHAAKFVDYFFAKPTSIIFIIVAMSSYILGHLIKVLSIVKYEFLSAFIDKFLIKIFKDIKQALKKTKLIAWAIQLRDQYIVIQYILNLISILST